MVQGIQCRRAQELTTRLPLASKRSPMHCLQSVVWPDSQALSGDSARRREFIIVLGGASVVCPTTTHAQRDASGCNAAGNTITSSFGRMAVRRTPSQDTTMKTALKLVAGLLGLAVATFAFAQDNKLRLITWADYVPADVVAQFKKETGIDVEITLSNNEEMISKLRATGGAGFDLAQPSQDRIVGPQQEFGIYKPMDMSKIKTDLFIPSMLDATKKNTTQK